MEDSPHKTPLVTDLLVKSGLTYTHLHMPTTKDHKLQEVGGVVSQITRSSMFLSPKMQILFVIRFFFSFKYNEKIVLKLSVSMLSFLLRVTPAG